MTPRFRIMMRYADGQVGCAFTWTRNAASGIARAWRDADDFAVTLSDVWAEEIA